MTENFKRVYKNKDDIFCEYLICKHCGERVERGIVSVSHHLMHCLKNTRGLIVAENDFEKKVLDSWSINVDADSDKKPIIKILTPIIDKLMLLWLKCQK